MNGDFTRTTFDRQKHYHSVRMQQGRVQIDADWNEQLDIAAHRVETGTLDAAGRSAVPMHAAGFDLTPQGNNLLIGAGRAYVEGILCENEQAVLATAQPDLPANAAIVRLTNNNIVQMPPTAGVYLAYLDVWPHHLTALDDPAIREVALGGPDTSTRTKTVWQMKLLQLPDANVNCLSVLESWNALVAPPTARLRARTEEEEAPNKPCIVAPGAGYRRLENQLYRVEIHESGALGSATFKWSRDNGSVAANWDAQNGNELTLSSPGRDKVLGFAGGQWVELTDDGRELLGKPGRLVRIAKVEGNVVTIDPPAPPLNRADFPLHPRARRWDSLDELDVRIPGTNDGWIPLEDGIEIKFQAGAVYQTGQYWLIPARTIEGDIEWPKDAGQNPLPLPPHGIEHRYSRLAILQFAGGAWTKLSDCRPLFPPATELTSFFYVSGDGQEVSPDPNAPAAFLPLPQLLKVGVANGQWPVANAKVRFTIKQGNGQLQGAGSVADAVTLADGLVACAWALDSTTLSQQVEATLLDAAGQAAHLPVLFTANLSVASQVAYDPKNCPTLNGAGVKTVQEAIDRLCEAEGCACTVCVSPDAHHQGAPSLQMAIDRVIEARGGRICLEAGAYKLREPLRIRNARSLSIVGKGVGSELFAEFAAVEVRDSADVALEGFSIVCRGGKSASGILLRSSAGVRVEKLQIENDAEAAVGLSGALSNVLIRDNVFKAPLGLIDVIDPKTGATGLVDLCVENNQFVCQVAAIRLTNVTVHQQMSRIALNRVRGCEDVGFELTGTTVPGFGIEVIGNELTVLGDGIVGAVDGLRIIDNDLFPLKGAAKRGIGLTKGSTGDRLNDCQIVGNRIGGRILDMNNVGFSHGIAATADLGSFAIARNQISDAEIGLLVRGAVESLSIDGNQIIRSVESSIAVASARGRITACSNQLETLAAATGVIMECPDGDCIFSNNHTSQLKAATDGVLLTARTLVVSSNRMFGRGVRMSLQSAKGACTVIGNITGGAIFVSGIALAPPSPFEPLNVQNV